MTDPFGPQSWGSLFKNTLSVYGAAFVPLLAIVAAPNALVSALSAFIEEGAMFTQFLSAAASLVVFLVSNACAVQITRDVAVGRPVALDTAFANVMAAPHGMLLLAMLLTVLLIGIGFVLLIVPGVIAVLMLMLVAPVIVLERRGVVESLKRSRELTRDFNLRHFGYSLLLAIIFFVALMGMAVALLFLAPDPASGAIGGAIIAGLFVPAYGIWVTLVYIEMRARKESLTREALAAEAAQ
jgi:hypothetical protein